jgi:hypothetical protein
MLQVASLQGGVPNLASKNAADIKVVRSLVILIAEGANGVRGDPPAAHAISCPQAATQCKPNMNFAFCRRWMFCRKLTGTDLVAPGPYLAPSTACWRFVRAFLAKNTLHFSETNPQSRHAGI